MLANIETRGLGLGQVRMIREHVRAFEYLGGVAATCLYDNMKVVVTGYDGDEPVYNTRFLAFAAHYGFRPIACRPRRSCTKGKIERQFDFVEKNLFNARTFRSLEHLNEVARWWLEQVSDVRIHPKTKQSPRERHQEELPHLIPLPAHPYDTAQVFYRCVNTEGLIVYCQNRYSLPWRYIGLTLPVRITLKINGKSYRATAPARSALHGREAIQDQAERAIERCDARDRFRLCPQARLHSRRTGASWSSGRSDALDTACAASVRSRAADRTGTSWPIWTPTVTTASTAAVRAMQSNSGPTSSV